MLRVENGPIFNFGPVSDLGFRISDFLESRSGPPESEP